MTIYNWPLGKPLREHLEVFVRTYASYLEDFPPILQVPMKAPYNSLVELLEFADREAAFFGVELKDITPGTWTVKIFDATTTEGAPAIRIRIGRGDRQIASPTFLAEDARALARALHEAADVAEGKFPS